MAYTALTLINRAWYLSGIVARGAQTVTGQQQADGLFLLNALLDWKSYEEDLIPFWTYDTSLVTVPGQETYFIPNCIDIETLTFNIDVVRYPMDWVSRSNYFGSARVDNISTLPFSWYFNRGRSADGTQQGGTLYMYFLPDGEYPLKFMGKFALQDVTLTTDMALTYDGAYIEYLRYALAQYMCAEYNLQFSPEQRKVYNEIRRQLMYVSPPDLSMRKSSILTQSPAFSWGDVNIGRGWRPN